MDCYYGSWCVQLLLKLWFHQSARVLYRVEYHMYGHLSSLRRAHWPACRQCTLILRRTTGTLNTQREDRVTLEYYMAFPVTHILSEEHVKSSSSIYQQLELAVARSSAASAQAVCSCNLPPLNKSLSLAPLLLLKWARRRSRSTLLVNSHCDE
jgi:hypothetical protein